ncbi:hypothetical protein [Mucilaginibacter sp. L3T2-6]|uniref:hypothetical protein n=1 Tax=Mucilaginibacter sp. L3T2-6 TaxID=3062491 RepID=UPI00267640AB|nr:hypothetical protein [Mucilaginibacter sp. L3T2-6]MDO3641959.1 hypothetical protein [Mucilaginibacter sp. L3T2-6]MDV6214363.1 hypothetical protein [Mucilaginibacter sp. L3T2-6]
MIAYSDKPNPFDPQNCREIIYHIRKMISMMNHYNYSNGQLVIMMQKSLENILKYWIAGYDATLPPEGDMKIMGVNVLPGYEPHVIIYCPMNAGYRNSPIIALENIGTPQMKIVQRVKPN